MEGQVGYDASVVCPFHRISNPVHLPLQHNRYMVRFAGVGVGSGFGFGLEWK